MSDLDRDVRAATKSENIANKSTSEAVANDSNAPTAAGGLLKDRGGKARLRVRFGFGTGEGSFPANFTQD